MATRNNALFPVTIRRVIAWIIVALILSFNEGVVTDSFAQRTGGRKKEPTESGIGRTGAPVKRPTVEEPKPERRIIVPPNEGYLALVTNNGATVTLSLGNTVLPPYLVKGSNLLSLSGLVPGNYKLEIKLNDDFEPVWEIIQIKKGKLTTLDKSLRPKYGTLILGLGQQAAPDVVVKLNGAPVEAGRLSIAEGRIYVTRVPIGVQEISLGKPGYDAWSKEITVRAGECTNVLAATMNKAAVTLSVKSLPRAKVYLNGELKGEIMAEGSLSLRELNSGPAKLRVELDGYEDAERQLTLSLDRREEAVEIPLTPIVEDAEFEDKLDARIRNWSPEPPEWTLRAAKPPGRHVKGETVALVYNSSKPNRSFNLYGDFTLVFDVRFLKGQRAAWAVRAQDKDNYYLFELERAQRVLNFYLCRNGECTLKDPQPVFADLSDETASYKITLTAKGNSFSHSINTPRKGEERLGGRFTDDTFRYGGVGLCGFKGLEMLVQQFFVMPLNAQ